MRQLAKYLILLLCFNSLYGQQFEIAGQINLKPTSFAALNSTNNNFDTVDARVRSYGADYNGAEALAEQILQDFNTKEERIRALYTWLCINIHYDMNSYNNGQTEIGFSYSNKADFDRKMKAINSAIVTKTFRTKKAICEGYAQTFRQVSEYLGIQCKLIGGYVKGDASDINNPPKEENHAWNAVKIDEKWYLIDATWGAGYTNGNRWTSQFDDFYFFTNPEEFALTHYPTESEWLLIDGEMTKKAFFSMPIYKKFYFINNLKLIAPKHGTIEVVTNYDITFLMGKIPENVNLYYAYRGDKYSQKIEVDCNTKQCNFIIPYKRNRDSELFIFANQKPILEFYVKNK